MNQFKADVTRLTLNDSGRRDPAKCQLVVIHTYECPRADDLENRAAYQERSGSSYTMLVGTRRTLRANDDNYIPWAAAQTANRVGLHLSFLAYARSTREEWLNHLAQLDLAARPVADWCKRYGIPARKITANEARAGVRGICGHGDVSQAWKETDHTDPGAGFPWDVFIERVKHFMNPPAPNPQPTPAPSTPKEPTMSNERLDQIEHKVNLILDQLAGPTGEFAGWPQLGDRTLVDTIAAIAEKHGISGARDVKKK